MKEEWLDKTQEQLDYIKKDLLKLIDEVDKLKLGEKQLKYLIDKNKKINEDLVTRAGRGKSS